MAFLRICVSVLALFILSASCLPVEVEREKRGTKTGAVIGALGGGAVGGKTGALAGAAAGGLAGHEIHKANKHADQANAQAGQAAFAEEEVRVKREGVGKKTGALAGAVAGGLAGGPVGAIGGAVLGGIAGHELHKHNHPKTEVIVPANNGNIRVRREGAGTLTGAAGGAAVGGLAAGPLGAAVGAGVGAVAGHSIHDANKKADQANANAAAANSAPRVKREGAGTLTGAAGGAVAGGVVAGPIGAAVGAGVGALAGHAIHDANKKADQAVVNSAVASGQPVVVASH